jgi:hypothetical protein
MARTYARLMVAVWSDPEFLELTDQAQRTYFLLMSNPKLSRAGCIPAQPAKWARLAKNTTTKQVAAAIVELATARFLMIDNYTEEVLIRSFIRHDGGAKNPNLSKSIASDITLIESPVLRAVAIGEFERAGGNPQLADPVEGPSTDPPTGRPRDPAGRYSGGRSTPTSIPHPSSLDLSLNPSPSSSAAALPEAAAAAIELLIQHRISTEVGIRNVTRYAQKVREDHMVLSFDRLCERERRGDTPREIAVNVLGLTTYQASLAELQLRQQQTADPDCEHCHGEGIAQNSEGRFDTCECRGLASVHELRRDPA